GFRVAGAAPTTVGRVRGIEAHPDIDAAVDRLLATAELEVVDVELPGWGQSSLNGGLLLVAEAYQAIGHLLEHRDRVGADVAARIEMGAGLVDQMEAARAAQRQWQQELAGVFDRVPVLALPTTLIFPPRVDAVGDDTSLAANTMPVNAASVPALALPAPTGGPLHASVQLVGPLDGEEQLL